MSAIPPFSSLPLKKGDPPYSAWGLYGDGDERGAFNRLTPELVLQAKEEIQTGRTFSLNNPLDVMAKTSVVGRKAFEMNQYAKLPRVVCDCVWTMNSQCSTQWDGLRHWAYQSTGQFYGGRTLKDFFNEDKSIKSHVNGIQNWEETGIVGRGVLLDFDRWRRKQNIEFSATPLNPHKITVDQLQAVAEDQGTDIKFGDILFVRTGFTKEYAALNDDDKKKMSTMWQSSGLVQSEQALEWIWSNFSAVAADHITFEYWPSVQDWYFHDVLIAGWGMSIGELFNLDAAAEYCAGINRWSFFVSSEASLALCLSIRESSLIIVQVCNVPGAVASPANLLAIF